MNGISNNKVMSLVRQESTSFVVLWLVLFLTFFVMLLSIGFVPSVLQENAVADEVILVQEVQEPAHMEPVVSIDDQPTRIIIDRVGVDFVINNPASRDIPVLDVALQSGVVHYPGSGDLEDTSNIFLFGHSSHLPVVHNKAYQAFNDIEKLVAGDIIRVQSKEKEYIYKVTGVEEVDANEAWVELSSSTKKLTLSTCNTFGSKQDRFVVEALFVGAYPLEA